MKITVEEVAMCGLCRVEAVRKAVQRGVLDLSDPEGVFGYILGMRVKSLGLGFADGLGASPAHVEPDLHYIPDSQEVDWA